MLEKKLFLDPVILHRTCKRVRYQVPRWKGRILGHKMKMLGQK